MQLELFASSPFAVRLSVPQALDYLWEYHFKTLPSAPTRRRYFDKLKIYFKHRYVDEISEFDIRRMREYFTASGLKPNTVNIPHGLMTLLYSMLYRWRRSGVVYGIDFTKIPLPETNPGKEVPKVSERNFRRNVAWPKSYVNRLVAAAIELQDLDMAEKIQMLYWTARRQGELFRMKRGNVDLPHGFITGVQNKTVTRRLPSGIPYIVPITPKMRPILERRLSMVKGDEPLFNPTGLRKRFERVRAHAGLPMVTLASLRASAATLMQDNGVPAQTQADVLGHTSLRMLPHYSIGTTEHVRQAHRTIESDDTEILKS